MATSPPPPPAQGGPGFTGFPQQQPRPAGAPGFGPPPGLPSSPGLPPTSPGLPPTPSGPAGGPGGSGGAGGTGRKGGNLRRNAVWAFVGAILASVVWSGAVAVVPRMVQGHSSAQSIHGYHAIDKICEAGKLTAFRQKYKMVDNYPLEHTGRSDSMDIMRCYALMKRSVSGSDTPDYATLDIRVELHKAVDSSPEYAATRHYFEQQKFEIADVPNLGQEAYYAYGDEPTSSDKTFHDINYYLVVRDGGMTFSLYWTDNYQLGKDATLERDTVRRAMLDDTRDILKAIGGK
ncbi:hypothetical protein J5Y04_19240 [Kitasatospora sp. RG8]|uniref:hypothetical protein n=1 Tax=Kitasatospora sp. RG8 TaxID=2820815 RepID=UPI001ADF88D7|nr:hypothetical protein [Kitasatospora sp. RG8]MBP0451661.1 hypothetical protein [Kitasatospora sp. RG8]